MLEHKKISNLNDFFTDLSLRKSKEVYFYRINGYSEELKVFLKRYYEVARRSGVVVEGKIMNPTEQNLSYYNEVMGINFQMNKNFIYTSLTKWLPRTNQLQRDNLANSMYTFLDNLKQTGKNENMLRNAYIKFMCWLYYRFERIVNQLGQENIPKILYEGIISNYELMLLSILSNAGCDVVILQYQGDESYLKLDSSSQYSDELHINGMKTFPLDFSVKAIREETQRDLYNERLYGVKPTIQSCTNQWMRAKGLENITHNVLQRGENREFFYNCFLRVKGVEDRLTYENELYQLQLAIKNAQRRIVVISETIKKPTPQEITQIRRNNYTKVEQLILDLASNIEYTPNIELHRMIHKAFVDIILQEYRREENLNKLTNKAVYLLCWIKRYLPMLFINWNPPEIGCFIYLGGCKDQYEVIFLQLLARLPIDVVILCPNLNVQCCLEDNLLCEIVYSESLSLSVYPENTSQVKIRTVAFQAERELDTLLYQDTGMFRNEQYKKANIICLQTMYEEIHILWNQELKYRPSFSTLGESVNIPVIFAKVSGIQDGAMAQYWQSIRTLITEDTLLIKKPPYMESALGNPMKAYATEFYRNGKLLKSAIKKHPQYAYGILKEYMQDFILEKLEDMIVRKLIKGIGENGTEYLVIAQVLNLPKAIVRMIQKFDFTKKNPKIIYINTLETVISLEDTIIITFLNLIGFDILFFVPTGYQSIEKYFNQNLMEEHQIGEYRYDMEVPELKAVPSSGARGLWGKNFFKR